MDNINYNTFKFLVDQEPTGEQMKYCRDYIKKEYKFRFGNIKEWPLVFKKKFVSLLMKFY